MLIAGLEQQQIAEHVYWDAIDSLEQQQLAEHVYWNAIGSLEQQQIAEHVSIGMLLIALNNSK